MSLFSSILIVDDEKNSREGLKQFLEAQDYDVMTAADGQEGFNLFLQEKPDLVLADMRMPNLDGLGLLEKIKRENPNALVILMTAYGSVEDAVKSIKNGAFYYLTKPVNLEELQFLIKKALNSLNLETENRELRQALYKEKFEKGEIIAGSKKMDEVLKTVDKIAQSNASVLIEGESGTGKELIAHRIHALSPRKDRPFVAVHCSALTETLLASELFGHERGSFTGATERKIGRFERAHQGSLFLDEIGEISPEVQVKLLRVLQEGEFERVGGTKTIKVDIRLICATNKNLIEEVRAGRFREDLYYRINVIYLKLPSLRERKEDIAHLAESFVKQFALANGKKIRSIEPEALEALKNYSWPGNIRELKNIIERMVVLCSQETITFNLLPDDIRHPQSHLTATKSSPMNAGPTASLGSHNLSNMEKEFIKQALIQAKGNKSLAAGRLGISRRTLYRKMEEYQITD